jgi:putative membrane protein
MYIRHSISLGHGVLFSWRVLPILALWAALLTAAHVFLDWTWLQLPSMPIGVLGTAVSFYLGFKGSASYDRLWEARKIWGGIVNSSRTWGVYATTLVSALHDPDDSAEPVRDAHRTLIYRHVAWLAALRIQLLRPKPWEHRAALNDRYRAQWGTLDTSDARMEHLLAPLLSPEELSDVMSKRNRATQLVRLQGEHLQRLYAQRRIEDFRHMQLVGMLEEFYTLQGKCERIKNFPLPRQYASANRWFAAIFVMMLPLALLGAFHYPGMPSWFIWGTVPVTVLIGWVFYVWDLVLEYSETPFEGLINDIPMNALSRTIEIDLREILGESDLPAPIQAFDDAVLL